MLIGLAAIPTKLHPSPDNPHTPVSTTSPRYRRMMNRRKTQEILTAKSSSSNHTTKSSKSSSSNHTTKSSKSSSSNHTTKSSKSSSSNHTTKSSKSSSSNHTTKLSNKSTVPVQTDLPGSLISQMQEEINTLNLEKNELKHGISSLNISEDFFKEDDVRVKFYTGLPNFVTLMFVFDFISPSSPIPAEVHFLNSSSLF